MQCTFCGKTFDNDSEAKNHITYFHTAEIGQTQYGDETLIGVLREMLSTLKELVEVVRALNLPARISAEEKK